MNSACIVVPNYFCSLVTESFVREQISRLGKLERIVLIYQDPVGKRPWFSSLLKRGNIELIAISLIAKMSPPLGTGFMRAFDDHFYVSHYLLSNSFDLVVGMEYQGLCYFAQLAKTNGSFLVSTDFEIQTTGGQARYLIASQILSDDLVNLGIAFLERKQVEMADRLLSDSYTLSGLKESGYDLEPFYQHAVKPSKPSHDNDGNLTTEAGPLKIAILIHGCPERILFNLWRSLDLYKSIGISVQFFAQNKRHKIRVEKEFNLALTGYVDFIPTLSALQERVSQGYTIFAYDIFGVNLPLNIALQNYNINLLDLCDVGPLESVRTGSEGIESLKNNLLTAKNAKCVGERVAVEMFHRRKDPSARFQADSHAEVSV